MVMAQELTPLEAEKLNQDQARVERDFWGKLKATARKVPFIDDLAAVYFCAVDPKTPLSAKAMLYGALAYFILPIDFVADFMPILGFTDDAAVLYAAIRAMWPHINSQHRIDAQQALDRILQDSA
jgi:uncharacterized membrane protein YkvA (DUF1232 family)